MKRTFTFLLALTMLLSMVPATVFAAEAEETIQDSVAEVAPMNAVEAPEPSPEPAPAAPVSDEKAVTKNTEPASTRSDIVATVPVQYYKKKGVTPDPTVMAGTTKLKKGTHYTLTYEKNDAVGTDASVTITGLGNYADYKQTLPMAILRRDIGEGSAAVHTAQAFTGAPVTPDVEVYVAGEYLQAGEDFVAYYENNINAGTAKFRVIGIGNYCGTLSGTFQIKTQSRYTELTGKYNGNISGTLNMDEYSYAELVIAPGPHEFQIDHAINNTAYDHVATYQLHRVVGEGYELVKSLETEEGLNSKTAFKYDFSDIYEGETESGGAIYMLSFTYVDVRGRVYSGMRTLIVPAKMPDATFLQPEMVDVMDFRHGYATAYGLNGNLGAVSWESSDPSIVSVSDNVFTMHKLGSVTLTAKSGDMEGSIGITVMAEDLSQGEIFAFADGKATVIYDGRILEEGTDYRAEIAQTSGLWEVAITGTGVFKGQLIRYFDADGNGASHSHGFPSTCDAKCVRCDLRREPETEHRYETHKDEETHWQVCTHCGDRKDEAPHMFAGGNQTICTQCGDVPPAPEEPTYEYPPSDTDGVQLTQLPIPGSTIVMSFNTIAMGTDRAGIGLAPIPGKVDDDRIAVTDGMAQLEVRSEGTEYLFLLDGKYLTCGILGTTLYFADTPTAHSRWQITPAENHNWKLVNVGTQLSLSFLYSFAPYPGEDNPVCSLQLYQVGDLPKLPQNISQLAAPVMLTPEQNTIDGSSFLEWISVPYADAYEVYRSTAKTGSYQKVATVTTTFYQEALTASKTYYYKVKAVYTPNPAKNSNFSTAVSFVARLAAPTVSMTLNEATGRMVFTWEAIPGAKEYEIYRRESGGVFEKIGTTTKLTYTDTKATPTVTYYYAFRSISSTTSYSSDFSMDYQCMHHCLPPKVSIKLDSKLACPVVSWEKVDGARCYTIHYKYTGDTEFRIDSNYQGTSMTFTNAPGDSLCIFRVYPIGHEYSGNDLQWGYTEVSIVTGIATPNFTAYVNSIGCISAEWDAVDGAVKYELYRSTSETKGYTLLATITDALEYIDYTTPVGKKFYYKLVAVGNLSRSKDSLICGLAAYCATPIVTAQRDENGKPMLSWEKVEGAKQYTIYYSTSRYGNTKLGTTNGLSYTHTKAKAGTTYYYWVVANSSRSGYNSGYSKPVTCSVGSGTPVVTAKADAATGKPSLTWGKVDGAVKYRIYRKMPGEADFTVLTEQTATSYLDSSVPIDTLCVYKVQALGKTEELSGDPSREISVASALARPVLTATMDAATGRPTFTWTAVEGAVNYALYRSTKSTSGYSLVTTVDGTSYVDDTAAVGKTYYYKLVAMGNVGKSAETAYVKLSCKCGTPEITAENGATGKPVISWEKVSGAKKYTVYRATSETGKYSKLGTTTKLTYTDAKAKTGTQYFYKVIANASSSTYNSGYSNIASCNVICSSVTVTVKVDAATGKPSLSWKKVDGAAGYRILRQLPGEEDFTVIKEQTALAFLDTTAPIDTKCIYLVQVMGKTAALDSRMSAELSATSGIAKPVLKTAVDASGKPELRWQTVEGAVKYEIYRSTKSAKGYSLLATVEATGYTDETVAPGKTYYYKVIAIGEVSKSAESSYAKLSGKCATPEISVSINEDSGKPTLTWEKISGAKKYTVYRATSENGKYSKLGTTTKLTYTDSKSTVGKTYYYKIVANASSSSYSSSYSNIVSSVTICAKPVVKATTVAATGKPQLSWSKVTGAKEYWILLDVDGQATFLASTTKLSFIDEAAAPGETRKYAVWAINADPVCNSAMDAYTVTATCAQPKLAGKNAPNGKPQLTISAVEGATKYVIYRSTSKTKGYTIIDTTEGLTFTDISAVKGKTYYYKVAAISGESESAQSAYVKVTCKAASYPTSSSTNKDKGSGKVWDFARYNSGRLDAYEERDPDRTFFLNSLSNAYGGMYYLDVEEMRMFVGRNYGMPIVTSRDLAEATTWSTSDPTIATVNEVGFVTPLKEGTVTITATLNGDEPLVRTCQVYVVNYPAHTYAQLEAQAKVEAKAIADYVKAYPGLTTDLERIALAAKIINELYVANSMGGSILEFVNGDLVETMIPGYNQPYGTLVTFHSTCAGDVRALGMVLEYLGFEWYHVNENKWEHQWCVVYNVDGQTAFADGSMYGIAGYGERAEDGSNWQSFNGQLMPLDK